MKKINPYQMALSSLFFVLFVITALALLCATFSSSFAQFFSILNQGFYQPLVFGFCLCGAVVSLMSLIRSVWRKERALVAKIVALISCGFFSYLCLHPLTPSPLEGFLLSLFFFIAFVVLGLGRFLLKWQETPLAQALLFFAPSLNTCLFFLFALGLQSYLLDSSWLALGDFSLFCLGLVWLLYLLAKRPHCFGLYEYTNLWVLGAGILVFLLSAHTLFQAERCSQARLAFYVLGVLSWLMELMFRPKNA
ncbi:hypothetical protein [Helicobacter ailurogastricus]|uniref:Uncharacterized protein n=1 Tax=Helicobacter ailurogastricus TaxID=1578720 RepID=A0A0K2X4I9_9HELI|nr:hypothetical protein [Helicobacter ailurogastricus]CRF40846.1 hypothetical protein HAL011_06150 [Helicobacter ailurogastricus]CRF42885.1 hypothetical protein HAL013_10960 [Helicobacter ailurogastricus]CRF44049.1 hypothetical protein HAL09_06180 [Helicobacter ailurogastricus]